MLIAVNMIVPNQMSYYIINLKLGESKSCKHCKIMYFTLRDNLGKLNLNVRTQLRGSLQELVMEVWTTFNWPIIFLNGRLLWTRVP
jgi:hypothetical protein